MSNQTGQVIVWDPFVRFFHWNLVAAFVLAWLSAEEVWNLHEQLGYYILVLIGLRIVWGLIGTRHARFADFVAGPGKTISYFKSMLSGRPEYYTGHNPAGGWMIIALLFSLMASGITGVCLVESPDSIWEEVHEGAANLTLFLVLVHITAVVAAGYFHGENLIKAMLTGKKLERKSNV